MGKKRHDQLHKRRNRPAELKRRANKKTPRAIILIVGEGEKSEPNYFKGLRDSLRLSTVEVEVCGKECGSDPKSVLKYAKRRMDDNIGHYDEVWCVIDVERYGKQTAKINTVINEAKKAKIKVALSNPCFEVWILCHFEHHGAAFDRCKNVISEVKKHIKGYEKGSHIFEAHLSDKTDIALKNAKRLENQSGANTSRIERNPYTEVPQVVKRLRDIAKS